jgi:peptidoglycan/LPS O-acetylase OafA/YrhL
VSSARASRLHFGDGGSWAGSWHAVVARSFLVHAGLFAAGLLLAVLHAQVVRGVVRLPPWWRPAAWLASILLFAPALVALDQRHLPEHRATLLLSLSSALLLALVVLPRAQPARWLLVLSSRPLQWAGLVSYGVFLWNEPVVWLLRRQGLTTQGGAGFLLALIMTLITAGALALASWRLVERPAMAWRQPPSRAGAPAGLGTAGLGTAADPLVLPTQTSGLRSSTDTPASDGTTSRRGAAAKPTPATLGTATTAQPAASPAATPDGESSITTHRDGSTPSC